MGVKLFANFRNEITAGLLTRQSHRDRDQIFNRQAIKVDSPAPHKSDSLIYGFGFRRLNARRVDKRFSQITRIKLVFKCPHIC